ncbi:MAG: hypothetical protein ABL914_12855, partial [Novosphingobium sp.]|uniref:COG3904 family protein n=1 Tax=Novosphingobium sp. TaxID=1874826 RepID=UPI0032BC42C2
APAPKAAEPQPRIYLSADGTTVYLVGTILDDTFKRFDAVLSRAPKARTLFLASPGGLTLEARLIAAAVRKRKLNTYVEQYCASACTQLFVAGRERVMGKEAILGFHQAVGVDRRGRATRVNRATDRALSPTSVFGVNGNDTLRLAYELAGLDKDFITKVLAKNHEQMWFPTVKELTEARVITRLAEKPEFPLPEGSISKDDLGALLAKRPIWERASRLYASAYRDGFDSAWRLANTGSPLELSISSGRGDLVVAMMSRLSRASDGVVDGHLKLYGEEARAQAANGYKACSDDLDALGFAPEDSTVRFERTEDQLLVSALDSPPAVAEMSQKEALKIFKNDILPLLPAGFSSSNSCKAGFQMVGAIDRLTGKKRIKIYRAMLFLPDALDV